MSTILDARPQFLDSVGVRLSLGRLVIYKASTTTLADVWLDNERTVPALYPYQLTDAGWTDRQLFIDEAVTVHVQDYLGADVKIYDLYQDGAIAVFGSAILVDTIADLADVALPVDGMTVQVKLPFPPPYRRVPCQPVGLDEVPEDLPWAATRGKGAAC